MSEAERRGSPSFCSECGASLSADSKYCSNCGSPLYSEVIIQNTDSRDETKPWYFSGPILAITFLFITPLWAVLILADKRRSRFAKAIAAVVGTGYLLLLGSVFFVKAPLVSTLVGPGEIRFGSDYTESQGDISIVSQKSSFSYNDDFAWVAHLGAPVGTTRVDLVLSKVTASGGEQVIERSPMDLADSRYTALFGKPANLLSLIEPGHYRLRVMLDDRPLAVGDFTLTDER